MRSTSVVAGQGIFTGTGVLPAENRLELCSAINCLAKMHLKAREDISNAVRCDLPRKQHCRTHNENEGGTWHNPKKALQSGTPPCFHRQLCDFTAACCSFHQYFSAVQVVLVGPAVSLGAGSSILTLSVLGVLSVPTVYCCSNIGFV